MRNTREERDVIYKDERLGEVERYWVARIKDTTRSKKDERLVVLTGFSFWGGPPHFQYDCLEGGGSIAYPSQVIEIVDKKYYLDSEVWCNAKFNSYYDTNLIICPDCKKHFMYLSDYKEVDCELEQSMYETAFKYKDLSDEEVARHNRKVIKRLFKDWFNNIGRPSNPNAVVFKNAPETLCEKGAELNKFKEFLTEDDLEELREDFIKGYKRILKTLKTHSRVADWR